MTTYTAEQKQVWRKKKLAEEADRKAGKFRRRRAYLLRLSDAEYATLRAQAEAQGTRPSALLRRAFLAPAPAAGGASLPSPDTEAQALIHAIRLEFVKAVVQVQRAGSNLNQITRTLNVGDGVDGGELARTVGAVNEGIAQAERVAQRLRSAVDAIR